MKRQVFCFCLLGALLAASCSRGGGTPEQRFIRDVASALGGVSAVEGTDRLVLESVLEGEGESYWLGENRNPDADLPVFRALFRWAFDWENDRFRKEELRIPQFLYGNAAMSQLIYGLDGDAAYEIGVDVKVIRQPDPAARERKAELRMHPIGMVRAALAPDASIGPIKTSGGADSTEIKLADGSVLTLVVDSTTKLPSRISTRVSHPILGDVVEEIEFADYRKESGVMVPANFVVRYDNKMIAKFRAVSQKVNFDPDQLLPDAAHNGFSKSVRLQVPPVVKTRKPVALAMMVGNDSTLSLPVQIEEAAPGVWYVTGGAYYSVLVEFADHMTLIEAPVDDQRFDGIIAKAKELAPSKPVTELVVTHHHFDHLGGVRAAIAAGLTLYVRGNVQPITRSPERGRAAPSLRSAESFYEDLARQPHTLVPDTLAKAPKTPIIKIVEDKLTLSDATRTMDLYPIEGSEYADTLLMAYLPKEQLLVEADVYTPPADEYKTIMLFPFAPNLLENIEKRKLTVERILPLHGRIVPLASLVKFATAPKPLDPAASEGFDAGR